MNTALDNLATAIAAHVATLSAISPEREPFGPINPEWVVPAAQLDGLWQAFADQGVAYLVSEGERVAAERGHEPAEGPSRLWALVERGSADGGTAPSGRTRADAARLIAAAAWIAFGYPDDQERAQLIGCDTRYDEPVRYGDPRVFLDAFFAPVIAGLRR